MDVTEEASFEGVTPQDEPLRKRHRSDSDGGNISTGVGIAEESNLNVQKIFDTLCLAPGSGVVWFQNAKEKYVGQMNSTTAGTEPSSENTETNFGIFDVNLHDEPGRSGNIVRYLELCMNSSTLLVTTSCYSIWNKHKKINCHAKVIPAVPVLGGPKAAETYSHCFQNVRVFFFDDNLDLDGGEQSPGICNLRDINTGNFVEFGEGKNGFRHQVVARHTGVVYSTEYRTVLVQANILDALSDKNYFTNIISRFANYHEKILVFMDVNSTLVCVDTVKSKFSDEILLSTMFGLIDLKPRDAFDFVWDCQIAVKVDKPMTLKQIAKKITKDNHGYYNTFYMYENCKRFFTELSAFGDIKWSSSHVPITLEAFCRAYDEYKNLIAEGSTDEGIAQSWFECFQTLSKAGHTVCMNSFGVDTRKIVLHTVSDEHSVIQIAINFNHWDAKDVEKFEEQYGAKCKRESIESKHKFMRNQMHKLVRRSTVC